MHCCMLLYDYLYSYTLNNMDFAENHYTSYATIYGLYPWQLLYNTTFSSCTLLTQRTMDTHGVRDWWRQTPSAKILHNSSI